MNKSLLLSLIALVAICATAFAQTTIGNAGMENWTGSGNSIEPQYWNSTKSAGGTYGGFAPQTIWQEATNPHGGTYCAKIVTGNALGNAVNGALTTGRVMAPSTNKAQGYIYSIPNDNNYHMTFTGRPDSFAFWYRFTPAGADFPRVEARLCVGTGYAPEAPVSGNHPDSTGNIVARAQWQGTNTTVSGWVRICVPFVYVDNRIPDNILVTSTSSGDQLNGVQNSTLWLDDFDAIYNPTIATGTVNAGPYYVSAAAGTSISVPFTLTGTYNGGNTITAQLSNAAGSFASPVTLGSSSTTSSGTVNGTIPANTASGSAYRVRVVSSSPALTANDNGSNITINLVSNSIAPASAQTIAANANGNQLTLTASSGSTSTEWMYATASGGPYTSFSPMQMSNTYTPNFATPGNYYVVAVSTYPGGLQITSNEVLVNVVGNAVTPASPQSLLVSTNGTQLTVTETPAGSWREWLYSTTSGSGYQSFAPAITGSTTYTPNFNSAGIYYVVCQSDINGVMVTSNEVVISVSSVTLSTGSISGSPFQFSASAPAASVSVPYTTSAAFNGGNTFTAQLSDASGSFASPVNIGSVNATTSGTITASIPSNTAAGTGYRIRVIASNPNVFGSDNGTNLVVDQFNNSIAPPNTQTIMHGVNGTAIAVFASQTSTQEWKFSLTSGSGYVSFGPAETGSSYTPNFATPGTYYVVAVSKNQYNDEVTSNEVQIDVQNGSTITTSAVSGSPFYISPSANVGVTVNFTSDVVFDNGNAFKAQLSDQNGSFANPVEIGTLSGATIGAINATIPNSSVSGNGYRIRVVSTSPAVIGSDNGTNLQIIPQEVSIAPVDTQNVYVAQWGNLLTATTTHPNSTFEWQYAQTPGFGYVAFSPAKTTDTLTPKFNIAGPYYIICKATNSVNDVVASSEVVIIVSQHNGLNETANDVVTAYWNHNDFVVDLSGAKMNTPVLQLINVAGQIVVEQKLNAQVLNTVSTSLDQGIYIFRIVDGDRIVSGKTPKK